MRSTAFIALLVCVAALALFAAGCGATAGEATPGEWADELCTTLTEWTDEVARIGDAFSDLSSLSADTIDQATDDFAAATDKLGDDLESLDRPNTDSGDAAKLEIDAFVEGLEAEVAAIESVVDRTSGLSDIQNAVRDISTTLTRMNAGFTDLLDDLGDVDATEELETALEESSACDEIAS